MKALMLFLFLSSVAPSHASQLTGFSSDGQEDAFPFEELESASL